MGRHVISRAELEAAGKLKRLARQDDSGTQARREAWRFDDRRRPDNNRKRLSQRPARFFAALIIYHAVPAYVALSPSPMSRGKPGIERRSGLPEPRVEGRGKKLEEWESMEVLAKYWVTGKARALGGR